jgi:predicted ester cyclase
MLIKDIAEKFMKAENDAWLKGNVDAFDAVDSPDVVYHLIPGMPDIVGRDAHKQYIAARRQAFTGIKFDWQYLTGEGSIFAVYCAEQMTSIAEIPGMPLPPGTKIALSTTIIGRVNKDYLAEVWMATSLSVIG